MCQRRHVVAVFLFLAGVASAQTQILSDFDASNDGWSFLPGRNATSITYTSNGGVGGSGAIILNDVASGGEDYFLAPAKFLGDMSAYYGGTLSFDLKLNPNWSSVYSTAVVVLKGTYNGNPLSIGYTPPSAQFPNATTFTTLTFNLSTATAWQTINASNDTVTGSTINATQLQAVLGSLTELRIWGDWTTSTDADLLDNVKLTSAIPEAATWPMAVTTFAAAVLTVYRRKRTAADVRLD